LPKKNQSETYLCIYDLHYPFHHKPTFDAALDFLSQNKVDGFLFGGDQFDNQEISPHNRGKGIYKLPGSYRKNTEGFERDILRKLEPALSKEAEKIYILGNHCDWEFQLVERHPELQGTIERPLLLSLEERGWNVVQCGQSYKHGKLTFIHGETLTGVGNQASQYHAKKAVESYCSSVLYGHLHSPQSYTKVLPHDETEKWMAECAPGACEVNPTYLRNRPTAWVNGLVIVEFHPNGNFNIHGCVVSNGKFAYGGKIYGSK